MGRTADAGCATSSLCAPMPRKPTSWYRRLPASSFAWRPSTPTMGRADSTGVTVVVTGAPPRSTVMLTSFPAEARIHSVSWSQLVTVFPSKEVTWSLGRSPAAAAGVSWQSAESGSTVSPAATWHLETSAMVVVGVAMPKPIRRTAVSARPISRFMAGPPSITMTFFHTGRR